MAYILSLKIKSFRHFWSKFDLYSKSDYTERTIKKREPEWLYDRANLREEHFRPARG